jgi:hypothetical protein
MSRVSKEGLWTLPGVGVSMLPKLACPACWPAYSGLLTSLGLGFLINAAYLLPLTAALLVAALAAMAFRATRRNGYGPLLVGFVAATGIVVGKFIWESKPTVYGAIGLLIVAGVWNAWPHRSTPSPESACSASHGEEALRS